MNKGIKLYFIVQPSCFPKTQSSVLSTHYFLLLLRISLKSVRCHTQESNLLHFASKANALPNELVCKLSTSGCEAANLSGCFDFVLAQV
jgi:hypothetical protein